MASLAQEQEQRLRNIDDATPELSIDVLAEYRGKGIGTELMSRVLHIAGNKYKAVSLNVSEENPAMRLYKRLGFEIHHNDGTSVIMKKESKAKSR